MSSYTLAHNRPQNRPALNRPQENCVQTKLEIGKSDDPYEKEANTVADRVMMMPVTPIAADAEEEEELQMQPNGEEEKVLQMQHQAPAIRMKCDECEEEEKMQMNPTPSVQLQNDESASEGASAEANTSETESESPNITINLPRPLNIRVNGVMYTSPTFLLEGPNGSLVDLAPYTGSGLIDFPLAALESLGIPILSFYHFHFGRARQYLGQDFENAFGLSGGTSFIRNAIHYGYISAGHVELYGAPSSYNPEHYEGLPDLNIVANPMDIGTMINVSYFNSPIGPHENNPTVLFTLTVPFDQNPFEAVTNLGGAIYHALSGDLYDLPDVTHNYPGFHSRPGRELGTPTSRTRISPKMPGQGAAEVTSGLQQQIFNKKNRGHSLQTDVRQFMENRFGTDFRDVNVHTDSKSIQLNRQLGSRAFTVGNDIHFNSGEYVPGSSAGKYLLAHELTHVVQQGFADKTPNLQKQLRSKRMQGVPSLVQSTGIERSRELVQRKQALNEPGRFESVHRNLFDNTSGTRQPWQGSASADLIFNEFKANFPEQPPLHIPQRTTENEAETDAIVADQRIRSTFSEITTPVSESRLRDAVQIMDNSFFQDEEFRRAWLANQMIKFTAIEEFDIEEDDPEYHALQDRLFNDGDVGDDIENKMRLVSAFARGDTPADREIFLNKGITAAQRILTLIHEIIHFYAHPQYREWIEQSSAFRFYNEGLTEHFARQVMTTDELSNRRSYQDRVDAVRRDILTFASESDVRLAFFRGEVWRLEHTSDEAKEAFGGQIGLQPDASRSEERTQSISSPGINQTVEENRHFRFMNIGIEQSDPKQEHIAFFQSIYDEVIRNNSNLRLRFVGHTSTSGSISYNRALSRRRVLAFYQMARNAGVPESQLINPSDPEFEGEVTGTAKNDSVIGRAMNRRVELYLVPPDSAELEDNIFHLERLRGMGAEEDGISVEHDLASVVRNSPNPSTTLPFTSTGWDTNEIMTRLGQYDIIGGTDSDSLRCVQAVAMASYIPDGPGAVVHYLDIIVQDARQNRRMNQRRRTAIEVIDFVKNKLNDRTATYGDLSWAQEAVHDLYFDDVSGTDENEIISQISPALDSTRSAQTLDVWTASSSELMNEIQNLQAGEKLVVTAWKVFFDQTYEQLRDQGITTRSPMRVNVNGRVVTISELNPTSRPAHTSIDVNRDKKAGHQLLIFKDNSERLWFYEPELHRSNQHLFEITDASIFDQYFTELAAIEVYEYVQIIGKIAPSTSVSTP